MEINILILAAGQSKSSSSETKFPPCLAEVDGMSLIEKIVRNTKDIPNANYTFAFSKKDMENFYLNNIVSILVPNAKIICTQDGTLGSACTALLAACQLDQKKELLIISANELVDVNLSTVVNNFRIKKIKGGVITFRSIHPRYSYVTLNEEKFVTEIAQQNPISSHATAGIFWYSMTEDFIEAAKNIIRKDANISGQYFVALTFNELILIQARIGVFEIDNNLYHPLKTEQQAIQFENGI